MFSCTCPCCFTRARSYSKLSCEMITRIWRGWTTPENADVYQALLLTEIFPGIESRGIAGYCGISLGRRNVGDEVEFVTLMWFDSLANVKTFSGVTSRQPLCRRAREAFFLASIDGRRISRRWSRRPSWEVPTPTIPMRYKWLKLRGGGTLKSAAKGIECASR